MEKKVIVCDTCNQKLADYKCEICSKDICESCLQSISFILKSGDYGHTTSLTKEYTFICKSCIDTIFTPKKVYNFKKELLPLIKNTVIVENLNEKK